jgi:hypothetical protein
MTGEKEQHIEFDHVGVPTTEKQPDEDFVESTRVWVTNPRNHPYCIEYLRFEPDSPCGWELKNRPHVAYKVENLDPLIEGQEIVLEPFFVGNPPFCRVAFIKKNGLITEYMQYLNDTWFGR